MRLKEQLQCFIVVLGFSMMPASVQHVMLDAERQLEAYLKGRKLVELAEATTHWLDMVEQPTP